MDRKNSLENKNISINISTDVKCILNEDHNPKNTQSYEYKDFMSIKNSDHLNITSPVDIVWYLYQQAYLLGMIVYMQIPNSKDTSTEVEYKTICDGRGSTNVASHNLKILYLKQNCWLCNEHMQHFQKEGLIESYNS